MKKGLVLFLTLCLLLAGCGKDPDPVNTTAGTTAAPTTEATTVPPTTEPETEPTTEPTTVPTTEPEPAFRSPLTGEGMEEQMVNRPIAVVVNNVKAAQPQHGVSDADILYEILAEGGVTRCLAVFSDISMVGDIGSVRSARTYFIDLARAYDAILIHAGKSEYAQKEFSSSGMNHFDGLSGMAASYFYRSTARKNAGYSYEHTLFTSGDRIAKLLAKQDKYDLTREAIDFGWTFAEEPQLEGEAANKIVVQFLKGGKKKTTLEYNAETGLYEAYQHNGEYIDGNSGETLSFRNVVIIKARTTYDNDGSHQFVDLVATGDGWYACDGKIVPIKWTRTEKKGPFIFTHTDGTPIELGVGKSYMAVTPGTGVITYE